MTVPAVDKRVLTIVIPGTAPPLALPASVLPALRWRLEQLERDLWHRDVLTPEDYELEDGRTIPPLGNR